MLELQYLHYIEQMFNLFKALFTFNYNKLKFI